MAASYFELVCLKIKDPHKKRWCYINVYMKLEGF